MGSHQPLMLVLPLFIMFLKASLMAFCILICGILRCHLWSLVLSLHTYDVVK